MEGLETVRRSLRIRSARAAADSKASGTNVMRSEVDMGQSTSVANANRSSGSKRGRKRKNSMLGPMKRPECCIDPVLPQNSSMFVYSEGSTVWNAMLNQTDVQKNANKFYRIDLLGDDSGNYFLWTHWGRIGFRGQFSLVECDSDIVKAKKLFERQYQLKTGNIWLQPTPFVRIEGRYVPIGVRAVSEGDEEVERAREEQKVNAIREIEAFQKSIPESKLDIRVQGVIRMICDVGMFERALESLHIDTNRKPLGQLDEETIRKGGEVLSRIEKCLNRPSKNAHETLVDLTSLFYSYIPHYFGMHRPQVIDSRALVVAKRVMLESLTDISIASSLLKEMKNDLKENIIDKQYRALHCKLIPVERSSLVWGVLESYVRTTHAPTHESYSLQILDVFEVLRSAEGGAKFSKLSNHRLLWHGSGVANVVGILSQGLRIAPPEAPITGHMFGKGIYGTNSVSKAANYSRTSSKEKVGCCFLADFALGKMRERTVADPVKTGRDGYDSTWGRGMRSPSPDTAFRLSISDGSRHSVSSGDAVGPVVPMGPLQKVEIKTSALQYDEFVLYDVKRIQLKFLVLLEFKSR